MSNTGGEDFLDLVYEASIDTHLWPQLLGRFAALIGGHGAALRSYDVFTEAGTVVSAGFDPAVLNEQFRCFASRNPLKSSPDVLRSNFQAPYRPGMKMDVEWLSKDDFVRTEYYNDFYKSLDIHSDISIGFSAGGGVWTGVDVYRPKRRGAFTADDLASCRHPSAFRAGVEPGAKARGGARCG